MKRSNHCASRTLIVRTRLTDPATDLDTDSVEILRFVVYARYHWHVDRSLGEASTEGKLVTQLRRESEAMFISACGARVQSSTDRGSLAHWRKSTAPACPTAARPARCARRLVRPLCAREDDYESADDEDSSGDQERRRRLKWDQKILNETKQVEPRAKGVGPTSFAREFKQADWSWIPQESGRQGSGAMLSRPVYEKEGAAEEAAEFISQGVFDEDEDTDDSAPDDGEDNNIGKTVAQSGSRRLSGSYASDEGTEDDRSPRDQQGDSGRRQNAATWASKEQATDSLVQAAQEGFLPARKASNMYEDAALAAKFQQARELAALEAKRMRSEEFVRRMRRKAKRIANKNINKMHKRGHPPPPGRTPEERKYKNAVKELIRVNTRDVDYFYSLLPDEWRFWSQLLIKRPQVKKTKMLLFDFHLVRKYEKRVNEVLAKYGPLLASVVGLSCSRPKNIRKFGLTKVIMVCPSLAMIGQGKQTIIYRKDDPPSQDMIDGVAKWFELSLAGAPRTLRDLDFWMKRALDRRHQRQVQRIADAQNREYSARQQERVTEIARLAPMLAKVRDLDPEFLKLVGAEMFYTESDPENPYYCANQSSPSRSEDALDRAFLEQEDLQSAADEDGDIAPHGQWSDEVDLGLGEAEMDNEHECSDIIVSAADDERADEYFYLERERRNGMAETRLKKKSIMALTDGAKSADVVASTGTVFNGLDFDPRLRATLVDSPALLAKVSRLLLSSRMLGVHCEFVGDQPSVICLSMSDVRETDDEAAFTGESLSIIIDLMAEASDDDEYISWKVDIRDMFRDLFEDDARVIVIHNGDRVISTLKRHFELEMGCVVDTQVLFEQRMRMGTQENLSAPEKDSWLELTEMYGLGPLSGISASQVGHSIDQELWERRPLLRSSMKQLVDRSKYLIYLYYCLVKEMSQISTLAHWTQALARPESFRALRNSDGFEACVTATAPRTCSQFLFSFSRDLNIECIPVEEEEQGHAVESDTARHFSESTRGSAFTPFNASLIYPVASGAESGTADDNWVKILRGYLPAALVTQLMDLTLEHPVSMTWDASGTVSVCVRMADGLLRSQARTLNGSFSLSEFVSRLAVVDRDLHQDLTVSGSGFLRESLHRVSAGSENSDDTEDRDGFQLLDTTVQRKHGLQYGGLRRMEISLRSCNSQISELVLDVIGQVQRASVDKTQHNVLISGCESDGKSSLLRGIVRRLSQDRRLRILVVDSCGDLGGRYTGDTPWFSQALGHVVRVEIPRGKAVAEILGAAVELHSPDVLAVDDVMSPADAAMIREMAVQNPHMSVVCSTQFLVSRSSADDYQCARGRVDSVKELVRGMMMTDTGRTLLSPRRDAPDAAAFNSMLFPMIANNCIILRREPDLRETTESNLADTDLLCDEDFEMRYSLDSGEMMLVRSHGSRTSETKGSAGKQKVASAAVTRLVQRMPVRTFAGHV
ncbi:protein ycf45 [Porphyridium purpureum]|uniref:Protein ycf45 n=1 Tax=Porphyridium purpureum TaxID=35688 RepID=A0A5J4YRU3_PORPP|nr:protein ycf45 [Porphyridium purpureum]|eukprot:POR5248..scf229_5